MSWNNFNNSMQNDGGFMNTSVNEGAAAKEKGGDTNRAQNCVPLMIGHILRHGDKITVWGNNVKIACLVAKVCNMNQMSTKIQYELEDETGRMKGTSWLDEDKVDYKCPVQLNSYAKIHGLIRTQMNEPYLLILSIRPVESLNELVTHLMEVTMVCLEGKKGKGPSNKPLNAPEPSASTGNTMPGLSAAQQMVLQIIQNGDEEYGAERDHIKASVPAHMASQVDDIIDFLSTEGHIYTTKTDDFFKAI